MGSGFTYYIVHGKGMKRNGFKKLLDNVKMNAMWLDEHGVWQKPTSPNNRARLDKKLTTCGIPRGTNAKDWIPSRCTLTEQDLSALWDAQGRVCYYFKIPLDFGLLFKNYHGYYSKHPLAPSVDKVDDMGAYELGNVVISSRFANWGRNIYPFEEFKNAVNLILEHGVPFDGSEELPIVNRTKRSTLEEFM